MLVTSAAMGQYQYAILLAREWAWASDGSPSVDEGSPPVQKNSYQLKPMRSVAPDSIRGPACIPAAELDNV